MIPPGLRRWLAVAVAVAVTVLTVRYLVLRSPGFFGADHYYIALTARDLAADAAGTSQDRKFYFPGAYRFWQLILPRRGDLPAYQAAWVWVLALNGGLLAAALGWAARSPLLAGGALLAYVSLALRLEGKLMTSEPIASLPWLLGCLACFALLRRQRPYAAAAALGVGSGLALFVKQQGGLLSLGALGLVTLLTSHGPLAVLGMGATAAVTATGVFVVAMILEGSGLAGIRTGLTGAAGYPAVGDLFSNIEDAFNHHELLLWLVGVAVVAWAWGAADKAGRRRLPQGDALVTLLGIALCAFAASLWQFSKRHYAHYALLGLPAALLAVGLALAMFVLEARPRRLHFALVLLALGAVLLWVQLPQRLVAMARAQRVVVTPPHAAYAPICPAVRAGQPLLLVPSYQNALHWACGTHARGTRWGYAYGWHETLEGLLAEVRRPAITQVFIFRPTEHYTHEYERQFFARLDLAPFYQEMARLGFTRVYAGEIGALYTR